MKTCPDCHKKHRQNGALCNRCSKDTVTPVQAVAYALLILDDLAFELSRVDPDASREFKRHAWQLRRILKIFQEVENGRKDLHSANR